VEVEDLPTVLAPEVMAVTEEEEEPLVLLLEVPE